MVVHDQGVNMRAECGDVVKTLDAGIVEERGARPIVERSHRHFSRPVRTARASAGSIVGIGVHQQTLDLCGAVTVESQACIGMAEPASKDLLISGCNSI